MSKRKQPTLDSPVTSPLSSKFQIESPNDVSVWATIAENESFSSIDFSESDNTISLSVDTQNERDERIRQNKLNLKTGIGIGIGNLSSSSNDKPKHAKSNSGCNSESKISDNTHTENSTSITENLKKMPLKQPTIVTRSSIKRIRTNLTSNNNIPTDTANLSYTNSTCTSFCNYQCAKEPPNREKSSSTRTLDSRLLNNQNKQSSISSIAKRLDFSDADSDVKQKSCYPSGSKITRRLTISKLPIHRTKHEQNLLKNETFNSNATSTRTTRSQTTIQPLSKTTRTRKSLAYSTLSNLNPNIINNNIKPLQCQPSLNSNPPTQSDTPQLSQLTPLNYSRASQISQISQVQDAYACKNDSRESSFKKQKTQSINQKLNNISERPSRSDVHFKVSPLNRYMSNLLLKSKNMTALKWQDALNCFGHLTKDDFEQASKSVPAMILDFYTNILANNTTYFNALFNEPIIDFSYITTLYEFIFSKNLKVANFRKLLYDKYSEKVLFYDIYKFYVENCEAEMAEMAKGLLTEGDKRKSSFESEIESGLKGDDMIKILEFDKELVRKIYEIITKLLSLQNLIDQSKAQLNNDVINRVNSTPNGHMVPFSRVCKSKIPQIKKTVTARGPMPRHFPGPSGVGHRQTDVNSGGETFVQGVRELKVQDLKVIGSDEMKTIIKQPSGKRLVLESPRPCEINKQILQSHILEPVQPDESLIDEEFE